MGLRPLQSSLLFIGFQDSKNWPCSGKIFGLLFSFILFQKKEKALKNAFLHFRQEAMALLKLLVWEFSKKFAFKKNKKQKFKKLYLKFLAEYKYPEKFQSLF